MHLTTTTTRTGKATHPAVTMRRAIRMVMRAAGFRAGAPAEGADAADRDMIEGDQCHYCAREGLEFHPFTGPGGSYRSFALCRGCGAAVEVCPDGLLAGAIL